MVWQVYKINIKFNNMHMGLINIIRVNIMNIIIVGGEKSISSSVEDELKTLR